MFKTGFVGNLTEHIRETVFRHPEFQVTGCFYPDNEYEHNNKPVRQIPFLPADVLLKKNDVLIFNKANPGIMKLLTEALKLSRHIILLDPGDLPPRAISELIKLREEAQTVIHTKQTERANPALLNCLPLITHPSLMEIKLMLPEAEYSNSTGAVIKNLFKILDALMFLSPFNIKKVQVLPRPVSLSPACLISARIDFDSGSVANLLFSNITEKESFTVEVYQKSMLLKINMFGQELYIYERSDKNGIINTENHTFDNNKEPAFYNELETFYQSIISKNITGKELYEIFRIAELSLYITQKGGVS